MAGINTYLSIKTLSVINPPNQRAQTSRLAQKAGIFYFLPFRKKPITKGINYFRAKRWEIYSSQQKSIKQPGVTVPMSNKINFKSKLVRKDKVISY